MGAPKPFGADTKNNIFSSVALLDPVLDQLTSKEKSDSFELDVGSPEAGYSIDINGSKAKVTFSYSVDNDDDAKNGRLILKDSFEIDLNDKSLKGFQRVIEGGGTDPRFIDTANRLRETKQFTAGSREVRDFFSRVVLKLELPKAAPDIELGSDDEEVKKPVLGEKKSKEHLFLSDLDKRFNLYDPKNFTHPKPVAHSDNILNRRLRLKENSSLTSSQQMMDAQIRFFVENATSPEMIGALFCGSTAFHLGRALGGSLMIESVALSRLVSTGLGLAFEVPTFEIAGRGIRGFQTGVFDWKNLGSSLFKNYFTFAAFRGANSVSRSPLVSFGALHGMNELERSYAAPSEAKEDYIHRLMQDAVLFTQLSFSSHLAESTLGRSFGIKAMVPEKAYEIELDVLREIKSKGVRYELYEDLPYHPAPIEGFAKTQLGDLPQLSPATSVARVENFKATHLHGPFAFATTQGIGYGSNADAVAVKVLPNGHLAFLNADGAGYSGDPVLAAREIVKALETFGKVGDMPQIMLEANNRIFAANQSRDPNTEPAYGVAVGATIEVPSKVGHPHMLHLNWAGDARAMVLERDAHGDWQWRYSTVEENMPNAAARSPQARQILFQNLSATNLTQEIVLSPNSNVITNQLGMNETSSIRGTGDIEVPDSSHDLGRRPAPELAKGIPLKKGSLLVLGSDGLWENFLRTRYFLDLIKDCHTPEAVVKVATQEAHQRMEILDRIKHPENYPEALVESAINKRYVFIKDGKKIFVDISGKVYGSAEPDAPVIDHYKRDNFSMMAYLHEPLEGSETAQAEEGSDPITVVIDDPAPASVRDTDPHIQLPAPRNLTPPAPRPAATVPEVKLGAKGLPLLNPPPQRRVTPLPPPPPQPRTTPLPQPPSQPPALTPPPPPQRTIVRQPSPLPSLPPLKAGTAVAVSAGGPLPPLVAGRRATPNKTLPFTGTNAVEFDVPSFLWGYQNPIIPAEGRTPFADFLRGNLLEGIRPLLPSLPPTEVLRTPLLSSLLGPNFLNGYRSFALPSGATPISDYFGIIQSQAPVRRSPPPSPPALTPPPRRPSSSPPSAPPAGTYPPLNPPPRVSDSRARQEAVEKDGGDEVVFDLLTDAAKKAFQPQVPLPSEARRRGLEAQVEAQANLIQALDEKRPDRVVAPLPPPRSKWPTQPYPINAAGATAAPQKRPIPSIRKVTDQDSDVKGSRFAQMRKGLRAREVSSATELPVFLRPGKVLDTSGLPPESKAPAPGSGSAVTVVANPFDAKTVVVPQIAAIPTRNGPPPLPAAASGGEVMELDLNDPDIELVEEEPQAPRNGPPPLPAAAKRARPASDLRDTQIGDSRALATTVIDDGASRSNPVADDPYVDEFDGLMLDLNPNK